MLPKSQLRSYQQRTVSRMYESDSLMAVLKMGAGKTVSALTAIAELIQDGEIRHALVLAPKRVAEMVWQQEADLWAHTEKLRTVCLTGTPFSRDTLLHGIARPDRDVTICGIDNVQWLVEKLDKLHPDHPVFDLLVIDETSRFKDPKSKRGRALRGLTDRFKIRWGLTGTPRPNSLMDLWGPMQLVTAGKLWPGSFYKWQKEHFYMPDPYGYAWEILPGHAEILMAEAAAYSMTLGEGDMPDLPQLSILPEYVDLPPEARAAYNSMEKRLFAGDVVAANAAVATGKLAQISNGYVYGEGGAGNVQNLHPAKRGWLADKIAELDGEPAMIVYEYLEDRALIESVLGNIPFLGSGTSAKTAQAAVDAWNARKLPYLGLHPASGGHGLNLQAGGSRMLWIAPPWSAEMWDQTLARLHRPGQTEHVMVHVCCARDTIDSAKRNRVMNKLTAQAAFEAYLREWKAKQK